VVKKSEAIGPVTPERDNSLIFLRDDLKADTGDRPFVRIVRSRDELKRWLHDRSPGLQWLQVEDLLSDSGAWALAAQGVGDTPLDVVLSAPGSQFSELYRLVDARSVRDIRVTISASPGFLKAVRLAASLGFPVRLLPGQPSPRAVEELATALSFYLHDSMVEAPIEFFHSALAWMRGAQTGSLWIILEEDPAIFQHYVNGRQNLPRIAERYLEEDFGCDFVSRRLRKLLDEGAECTSCPWQHLCQGYFKWPDPAYSCKGVKQLFASLQAAADEMEQDIAACAAQLLDEERQG
jgi:hypothetical protein